MAVATALFQQARRNRLLHALPADDCHRLVPELEPVSHRLREFLIEPNQPLRFVYFPLAGIYSLVTAARNGALVEVATVGKEGMIGLPAFLGTETSTMMVFAQVPATAVRLPARTLRAETRDATALRTILQRYTQALFTHLAQSVLCNRIHPIRQRCARWLLMTHDRVEVQPFPLTHEFLSQMLGVRRASVTEVVGALQDAGLIRYRQGQMTVLDRDGLERAACECYGIIAAEYERLLP